MDRAPTTGRPGFGAPQGRRPRRTAVAAVGSVTAVGLIGTLVWVLGHDGGHDGNGGQASPRSATTGTQGGPTATGRTPTTGTVGASSDAGAGTSSGTSTGAGTQPSTGAPADLLTPAGVRATVAALRPHLSGTKVKELVVYPEYADAEAPTRSDPSLYDDLVYRDGAVTHSPGGTMEPDDATVALTVFDWNVLPGLLAKAQRTLNVPHPTSRYIIVGPDIFDNTPTIRVYLSDAYGSGYLSATPKGKVTRTYPRGS